MDIAKGWQSIFLSLPDTWPVGAVQKNFWDNTKGKGGQKRKNGFIVNENGQV